MIDWLDYNGYTVVTRTAKEFIETSGRRRLKGDIDIDLAIDAMEIAEHIDQRVLFSGNGNLRSLVEVMQCRGVRVTSGVRVTKCELRTTRRRDPLGAAVQFFVRKLSTVVSTGWPGTRVSCVSL